MVLKKFRDGFGRFVNGVSYIGLVLLFAMVFIVAIDIILRKLQVGRINGSNELTTYFMVAVCSLGIPALQYKNGHVWVNLLVNKAPYRARCFWRAGVMVVETVVIFLLAYGGWQKVAFFYEKATTSDVLNLPKWIFALVAFIAFVEYFVLSLVDTIQLFIDGAKNEAPAIEESGWSEDEVKGI